MRVPPTLRSRPLWRCSPLLDRGSVLFAFAENEFYVLVDAIPSGTWTIDGVLVDPDLEKRKLVGKGS